MGVFHITRKDLLLLSRDRRTLAVLLVMPLIFIAILGLSTGQIFGEGKDAIRVVIVDEDQGKLAAELVTAVEQSQELEVVRASSQSEADELVQSGDRLAKIVIGKEFQKRIDALGIRDALDPKNGIMAGGLTSLDITVDIEDKPSLLITRFIIERSIFSEAFSILLPYIARKNPAINLLLASPMAKADELPELPAIEVSVPQSEEEPAGGNIVYKFLVPGYTVCFAFFLINIMARSFLAERELGTLRRLKASPIGPVALLAGKTIPFFLVSLGQVALLFLCGRWLFGMSWGPSPMMLLPVIVGTSLAATSLGLLVAALVRSDAQVSAYGNLVVITLAAISGCFMPRDWLPDIMQQASLATPHAWALIAYNQLLVASTPNLTLVWQCCAMLVLFAGFFFALGWWRFRRFV